MISAIYTDEHGKSQHLIDETTEETGGNETRFVGAATPNTNYSITVRGPRQSSLNPWNNILFLSRIVEILQVTALTNAGAGRWSHKSKDSQCFMPPGLPTSIPVSKWRLVQHDDDPERRTFSLRPYRVSERNGPICCYRFVQFFLLFFSSLSFSLVWWEIW